MLNLFGAIRTLSPLHCGVGTGMNDIDLPVAKSKVSGHPLIPASSLKGVLKDKLFNSEDLRTVALFGSDKPEKKEDLFASAISIGDATLLALPVRSYHGTFAYLASPYTLEQFRKGLNRSGRKNGCPNIPTELGLKEKDESYRAMVTHGSLLKAGGSLAKDGDTVLLEELELVVDPKGAEEWAEHIADLYCSEADEKELFKKRFAIVDDNILNFLCETALPVDAHIRISEKTGTVEQGALWYEETVPPESLFFAVIGVDGSFMPETAMGPEELVNVLLSEQGPELFLQVGGKNTTGKGMVSVRLGKEAEYAQ